MPLSCLFHPPRRSCCRHCRYSAWCPMAQLSLCAYRADHVHADGSVSLGGARHLVARIIAVAPAAYASGCLVAEVVVTEGAAYGPAHAGEQIVVDIAIGVGLRGAWSRVGENLLCSVADLVVLVVVGVDWLLVEVLRVSLRSLYEPS